MKDGERRRCGRYQTYKQEVTKETDIDRKKDNAKMAEEGRNGG